MALADDGERCGGGGDVRASIQVELSEEREMNGDGFIGSASLH